MKTQAVAVCELKMRMLPATNLLLPEERFLINVSLNLLHISSKVITDGGLQCLSSNCSVHFRNACGFS